MVTPRILSCGIVPVFGSAESPSFLLLRAYNYWDFPKGVVEKDEAPLDAALRELREETTLTECDLKWGRDFKETPPYARGKVARYYVGQVKTTKVDLPVNPQLGRPEHLEYRWCSYEEAKKLVTERVRPVLDWAFNTVSASRS